MSTTPLQKPARAFLEPQSRAGVSPACVGEADAILALARSWGRRDACSRGEKGKKTCTHDNLGTLGREYCARKRCRRCALPPQSMTLAGSRRGLVCAISVQRRFPFFLSANFSAIISFISRDLRLPPADCCRLTSRFSIFISFSRNHAPFSAKPLFPGESIRTRLNLSWGKGSEPNRQIIIR